MTELETTLTSTLGHLLTRMKEMDQLIHNTRQEIQGIKHRDDPDWTPAPYEVDPIIALGDVVHRAAAIIAKEVKI